MSFRCKHCGYSNNEVKPGSAVQPKGGTYELKCTTPSDIQRQLVKSDEATVHFQELDFEIPSGKGVFTTLEGLLHSAYDELNDSQPQRREVAPEIADSVESFLSKLKLTINGEVLPLTVVVDDPTGNSYVENPFAPKPDPNMTYKTYLRTPEMQKKLGLQVIGYEEDYESSTLEDKQLALDDDDQEVTNDGKKDSGDDRIDDDSLSEEEKNNPEQVTKSFVAPAGGVLPRDSTNDSTVLEKEVYAIPSPCPVCGCMGLTKSCLTDIPYFQEILIMGFDCISESCGYKTNEIKGAGAVPEKGRSLRLHIAKKGSLAEEPRSFEMDMNRDLVKSNTAGVRIPELEIEVTAGSLGGCYTTVEGLLKLLKESLFEGQVADFLKGDSAVETNRDNFSKLEDRFEGLLRGEEDFVLELFDPLASSFIYSPNAPNPEPRLEVEDYERSFDENEELGLNDIKVDNYDTESIQEAAKSSLSNDLMSASNDDDLMFEGPFETFQGHRPNMVFRIGKKGLGYYHDSKKISSLEVLEQMRKIQVDGESVHPNPLAVQENQDSVK